MRRKHSFFSTYWYGLIDLSPIFEVQLGQVGCLGLFLMVSHPSESYLKLILRARVGVIENRSKQVFLISRLSVGRWIHLLMWNVAKTYPKYCGRKESGESGSFFFSGDHIFFKEYFTAHVKNNVNAMPFPWAVSLKYYLLFCPANANKIFLIIGK